MTNGAGAKYQAASACNIHTFDWPFRANTTWPGTPSVSKDGDFFKFELPNVYKSGSFLFNIDGNYKTKNQTTENVLQDGKYYLMTLGGTVTEGDDLKYSATLKETSAPVVETAKTYSVVLDPKRWDYVVELGTPQAQIGANGQWKDLVATGLNSYTVEGTETKVPVAFRYPGVTGGYTLKEGYAAANINNLTAATATGALTLVGTDYKGELSPANVKEYTLTLNTYGSYDAPVVTIGKLDLGSPDKSTANKVVYKFKTNKAVTGGTASYDGVSQDITFYAANTATVDFGSEPRKEHTFYLDANYMILHAHTLGNNTTLTAQNDWKTPVIYFTATKCADEQRKAMTPLAGGLYKVTLNAESVSMLKFESGTTNSSAFWDTRSQEIANPVADAVYRVSPVANADGAVTLSPVAKVGAYADLYDTTEKTYTITVKGFVKEGAKPATYLFTAADKTRESQLVLDAPAESATAADVTPARSIYTYTYKTLAKTLPNLTVEANYDGVKKNVTFDANNTAVADFPKLSYEYRVCGEAVGGTGDIQADGTLSAGSVLMSYDEATKTYTASSTAADGLDNKFVGLAYYTIEDGVKYVKRDYFGAVTNKAGLSINESTTLAMNNVAGYGEVSVNPYLNLPKNAKISYTFTPSADKVTEGTLKLDITGDYEVAVNPNGMDKYFTLSGLQVKVGDTFVEAPAAGADGIVRTSGTVRPTRYKYTAVTGKDDVATANVSNVTVEGELHHSTAAAEYAKCKTYMASPLVYSVKVTSDHGAPTEAKFTVDGKVYTSFAKPANTTGTEFAYTLITDQHAAKTQAVMDFKVDGIGYTVKNVDPGNPVNFTDIKRAKYVVRICGPKNAIFTDGWDDAKTGPVGILNQFKTTDQKTFTYVAHNVPLGSYTQEFGLRIVDDYATVKTPIWMQGESNNRDVTPSASVQTYVEGTSNTTLQNLKLNFNLTEVSDVIFTYVRDEGGMTGQLSVSTWTGTKINRATNDNVGGLDFSKATIKITKKDGTVVNVTGPRSTQITTSDVVNGSLQKVEFTDGVVVTDVDGINVPGAIENFNYANSKTWEATAKVVGDEIIVYANKPADAQYYSFCYHDWREKSKAPKKVEVKLADNTTLVAWHTKTPWLKEGETNYDTPDYRDQNANYTVNYDKSYGMVATPPKDAPGTDYWYMVMTDKKVNFDKAVVTVTPDAPAVSGAIPVNMTLTELPSDHIVRHYMNSQFRIYRVGSEVNWRLDQATEYVSNTGLFYVDGLIANSGTPTDELGVGYKFSTNDPRKDYDSNTKKNNWTNFDKGAFGYFKWADNQRKDINAVNHDGTPAANVEKIGFWGGLTGNVSPTVNGTLVIDLRQAAIDGDATHPGTMAMHNGFHRQTVGDKMLFYGGANVPTGALHIELSKIGLWNNDACQVLSFTENNGTYDKQYFWQIIGGFTVDAVKMNADNTETPVDLNGAQEGNTFEHAVAIEHDATFNPDFEFHTDTRQHTISLGKNLLPGTYKLTIKLKPTESFKSQWNDDLCEPLVLNVEVKGPSAECVALAAPALERVALTPPLDVAQDLGHKGNDELRPVKYSAVNEVVAKIQPSLAQATQEIAGLSLVGYTFKLDNADVTAEKETGNNEDYYRIFGLSFDAVNKSIPAQQVTVTPKFTFENSEFAGEPTVVKFEAQTNLTFPSLLDDVALNTNPNTTQVVLTNGVYNHTNYTVYSANPVFNTGRSASSTTTQLYAVGGFDYNTDNFRQVTLNNGTTESYVCPDLFDDYSFSKVVNGKKEHDFAPRMAYHVAGQLQGLAGYAPYKSGDWNNETNNWAELMMGSNVESFGMMVPHYYASTVKYTGDQVPKHGGFTANFYTYYPVRDAKGIISLVEVPGANVTVGSEQTGSGVTGVEDVAVDADPNALMDVYTVSGVLIMRNVTRQAAVEQLQPGLYIIGREKVAVQ